MEACLAAEGDLIVGHPVLPQSSLQCVGTQGLGVVLCQAPWGPAGLTFYCGNQQLLHQDAILNNI